MSFYGANKVSFIKETTEARLEKKMREIELAHDGMIKMINVYPSLNGGIVAWYYHDFSRAGAPAKKVETKITKKKASKKITKKVN